jgi:hypothetical protein
VNDIQLPEENHPNRAQRAADAASGGGIGILAVWVASLFGAELPPAAAATITTIIIIAAAALGRNGIRGLAVKLWRGANGDSK